jgi:predicted esterase
MKMIPQMVHQHEHEESPRGTIRHYEDYGHPANKMFERYNAVDEDDIRLAVDRMEGYLKSVDQNVDQPAGSPAIENKKD